MYYSGVIILLVVAAAVTVKMEDCGNAATSAFKLDAEKYVEVRYRQKMRRGITTKVISQAEILWRPQAVLEYPSCYDLAMTTLLIRAAPSENYLESSNGGGQYKWETAEDADQMSAGESVKWTVDVQPCLVYQFAIRVTPKAQNEEANHQHIVFQLPQMLGPVGRDEILASRYQPQAPVGFVAEVGADWANLSWEGSLCADGYEVNFMVTGEDAKLARSVDIKNNGQMSVRVEDLKPCTRYEVTLSALFGEEYSDDTVSEFATQPQAYAASDIDPVTTPTIDSVSITWETWRSVACIDEYQITLCQAAAKNDDSNNDIGGSCIETVTVHKLPGLPTVTYTTSNLDSCTDYIAEIQPVFHGMQITDMKSKWVKFKTLSPSADKLAIEHVSGRSVSSGSMRVTWSPLQCAAKYRVYQKETDANDWIQIADMLAGDQTEIAVDNITPCTKYHFAISAILDVDGGNSVETRKTVGPELVSDLDENQPFTAPNLFIMNADSSAEVSWGHADCIASYMLNICQPVYTDCRQEVVEPSNDDKTIHLTIDSLEPCTQYTLEVVPIIPGKDTFTARPTEFTTTNGIPMAPENFVVDFIKDNDTSDAAATLSWSTVQCATGYNIYSKHGEDGDKTKTFQATSGPSSEVFLLHDLVPCNTYYYSISSLVDMRESEKTNWFPLRIPPKKGIAPEIKIINRDDDNNITVRLQPAPDNAKCMVADYELRYSFDGGVTFTTDNTAEIKEATDGKIILKFPGGEASSLSSFSSIVEAKVRYDGWSDQGWSETASTARSSQLQQLGDETLTATKIAIDTQTLIPIIIGVAVTIIFVVVLSILIARRRKTGESRNSYDTEKAEHGQIGITATTEETQKLNPNPRDNA